MLTNPKPSSTASTIPAVRAEQLSWLISRGTEMWRVIGGSLSIIMSGKIKHNTGDQSALRSHDRSTCVDRDSTGRRTFVIVLNALLDRVCLFAKYRTPDLCMDRS